MQKKGQITIFVIIALVLVVAVISMVLLKNNPIVYAPENAVVPWTLSVQNYISSCLKQKAEEGLNEIGLKGGYYLPPTQSTEELEPYYALNGVSLVPEKIEVEEQIANYIAVYGKQCLPNSSMFPDVQITSNENPLVQVQMNMDNIKVDANYPIKIKKENSSVELSSFKIDILTHAGLMYSIASNYTSLFLKSKGLSLTYASEIKDEFNITSQFTHFPEYTRVILRDSDQTYYNSTYEWRFAIA